MQIWVDADACPKVIKEIILKAGKRTQTCVTFVANQAIALPVSPLFKMLIVPGGFDVADQKICDLVQPNDLVITADIPLAHDVVMKNAFALNPRGMLYTHNNVKQVLSIRNISESVRNAGIRTQGPDKFSTRDIQSFANHLDRFLQMHK